MADSKYYAWSNFPDVGKKVGDPVSQSDFDKMSDEEWQYLIDAKVVRTDKYPKISDTTSPVEHFKARFAAAAEDGNFEDLGDDTAPEPAKTEPTT